jgi:hypothetical protein
MVRVQILSREEKNLTAQRSNSNTGWFKNLAIVIRRRQTHHVKETTEVINYKAYNNEEDLTFRTGTVSDIEQYVLVDYNCKVYYIIIISIYLPSTYAKIHVLCLSLDFPFKTR